jgi:uncharacterized repeat protein (TIGR03803 family)
MRFVKRTFVFAATLVVVLGLGLGATESAQAQTFTLLYTFAGPPDGSGTVAPLVRDAVGNLYGTAGGGSLGCSYEQKYPCGIVFKVDSSGNETVLYRFTGGADGDSPVSGVILDAVDKLYGTTAGEAFSGPGTIFKLDPVARTFTLLHSIGSNAGLVMDVAGNLYGSTSEGIFKLDPATDTFTVLAAGVQSDTTLARDAAGNLYGTTQTGGITGGVCGSTGCGLVFKLDTTFNYTVLYSFTGAGNDGFNPAGGIVLDAAGNLYGTTLFGGPANCLDANNNAVSCGTVFKLSPAGLETVFDLTAGYNPRGSLVLDAAGNIYGTTYFLNPNFASGGLVFEMSPAGVETVLHTFANLPDGLGPFGGMVLDASGNLYGTTSYGGPSTLGTVFKIDPTGPQYFPLTVFFFGTGTVTGDGLDCSRSCATWVSPGTTFTLTATPPAGGSLVGWVPPTCSGTGTCSVTINSAQTVAVTFDSDFSVSATAFKPATVSPGASATSTISVVAAANGFFSSVALTCAVTPSPALAPTCSISPSSVMPGTAATLTVNTTAPTPALKSSNVGSGLFCALCLPLIGMVLTRVGLGSDRKTRKGKLTAAALSSILFAGLIFQVACGGGSSSTSVGGSKGTPKGTYTITVTGTYATGSLVHTTPPTTLTVQ